jgi:site-specific DNA-methyltransferase (adenine-specific)
MIELDIIICGDSLEVMRGIKDKYFDLILTDPPYGIGEARRNNASRGKLAIAKDYGVHGWDDSIPPKEYFEAMFRISKNQIIFGGNYFVEYLKNSPCWIVWDKNNHSNDFADCELIWTSFKTATRLIKYTWNGMLQQDMKNKEERYHPTQKPCGLIEMLLLSYSKEGDLICDPFLGSGTTAVACLRTKRHYLGIESSPEYCAIAEERIRQENMQLKLF